MRKKWIKIMMIYVFTSILTFILIETANSKDDKDRVNLQQIQYKLKEMGYIPDENGKYGAKTKWAIIAFQKVNKIKVDGIIGKETLKALENPRMVEPKIKENEKHIEVDLKTQVMLIVENNNVKYIIPISSGKNNSTVKGKFRIYRAIRGWHKVKGRPWSGYVHNPLYFYKAYAIHGYITVPNRPMSHGCIRIPLCYSDIIFKHIVENKIYTVYIY